MTPKNAVTWAGRLLCGGAVLFLALLAVAISKYPGYSFSGNFLSDLGVFPASAIFFNLACVLGGLSVAAAGVLLFQSGFPFRFSFALLSFAGLGLAGVGLFPENVTPWHDVAAGAFFFFAAVCSLSISSAFSKHRRRGGLLFALLGVLGLAFFLVWQMPFAQKLTVGMWLLAALVLGWELMADGTKLPERMEMIHSKDMRPNKTKKINVKN